MANIETLSIELELLTDEFKKELADVKNSLQSVQNNVEKVNKRIHINAWNKEHRYPEIGIGIGINSGATVLGNIGSADHMRFSAISRHVNLASRIQTYSHTGDIVMSQSALQSSNNVTEVEMIKTIVPKGIADPINIYRVKEIIEV